VIETTSPPPAGRALTDVTFTVGSFDERCARVASHGKAATKRASAASASRARAGFCAIFFSSRMTSASQEGVALKSRARRRTTGVFEPGVGYGAVRVWEAKSRVARSGY
jgi:hypothetical protein